MKKIIAFSGSNSSKSINQQFVKYVSRLITDVSVEVIDLRDYDAPIYSSDLEQEGIPLPIKELALKLEEGDAYIVSTPEHNGSLPAFFKNILDWSSRNNPKFFGGHPVMLLSASPGGYGGANALADLEKKMKYFGGEVIAKYSLASFNNNFDSSQGVVSDTETDHKINEAVESFMTSLSINHS